MPTQNGTTALAQYEAKLYARILPETGSERAWRDLAACRNVADPELFFDLNPLSLRTAKALSYCHRCPVVDECAASAARYGDWGVRGGEYIPPPDTAKGREYRKAAS